MGNPRRRRRPRDPGQLNGPNRARDRLRDHRLHVLPLKLLMFLLTAVLIGSVYRGFGGDPDLVALVSTLAGLGAIAAVVFAERMGLL